MKTLEEQVDAIDNIVEKQTGQYLTGENEEKVKQIILTAEKRERESTRPEKFNIPRIIKRGQIKSRFKITREESIYGYDLWRGHYVELGRSSGGFRDIQDTLRSCEEVAERLIDEGAEALTNLTKE